MPPSLQLAELLCARLCHELSSPMGTLAGVLEMITEGGGSATEAREVAEEASEAVRGRLKLLRTAWSSNGPTVTAEELRGLTSGLRLNRRTRIQMDGLRGDLPGPAARMIANLMLLGVESLAGEGVLTIAGSMKAGVTATLSDTRGRWPAALLAGLDNEDVAWATLDEARGVQAVLTALLAHASALTLAGDAFSLRLDTVPD